MSKERKRRPNDFKRRILQTHIHTQKELWENEFQWLQLIDDAELRKKYYNCHKEKHHSGQSFAGKQHTEDAKAKMREAKRKFLANGGIPGNTGKRASEETIKKLKEARKNRSVSEETKEKTRNTAKKRVKEHGSWGWVKGSKHTPEAIEKIRQATIQRFRKTKPL
jgi:hypothetical protein